MTTTHETATMRTRRLSFSFLSHGASIAVAVACAHHPKFFREMKERRLGLYIKKFIKHRKAITIQIHRATDPEIREISDLCDLPGLCLLGGEKRKRGKKREKKTKKS